jgi:hypothetical protein
MKQRTKEVFGNKSKPLYKKLSEKYTDAEVSEYE